MSRLSPVLLVCTLVAPTHAASAASPTAAITRQLKKGLGKQALKRFGGEWEREGGFRPDGAGLTIKLARQGNTYEEWNGHFAGTSMQSVRLRDDKGQISAVVDKTAGGALRRMLTVEDKATHQRVEIITKQGLFTIGTRLTAAKTAYGANVTAGMRTLRLGRLRIPIGRAKADDVHAVSKLLLQDKLSAQTLRSELKAPQAGASDSRDIALGRERTEGRATLDSFGAAVGGSIYRAWGARNVTSKGDSNEHFAERFFDALERTRKAGGRIKFDLTGVERRRFAANSKPPPGQITSWELAQLRNFSGRYDSIVDFYLQTKNGGYRKLSKLEAELRGY